MHDTASPINIKKAKAHLMKHDPYLASIITADIQVGITPHRDYFKSLIDSIIGQQLSVKAAHSIRLRFYELVGGDNSPRPEQILEKSIEELRSAGLSNAKARYIQDLSLHVLEKTLQFDTLDSLSNQEVIVLLTAVKGIGEWTGHMFMIFCMGRLDILPTGDLGIKNGIKKLYSLDELPTPDKVREIAVKYSWHPYESVASWYIWHSLDNMPK